MMGVRGYQARECSDEVMQVLVVDSEDAEANEKVLERLADSVRDVVGSGGSAEGLIAYATSAVESKMQLSHARDMREVEKAIAASAVIPLCRAAEADPAIKHGALFLMLVEYSEDDARTDFEKAIEAGGIDIEGDDGEAFSAKRVVAELEQMCSEGFGCDDEIDSILSDVSRFRRQRSAGELPSIEPMRGAFKRFKAYWSCVREQAKSITAGAKFANSKRDAEIWFSRYLLGAPIETAKMGYWRPLGDVAGLDDKALRRECSFYAKQIGVELAEGDVGLGNVKSAMRMFCASKTGYQNASSWLLAISGDYS